MAVGNSVRLRVRLREAVRVVVADVVLDVHGGGEARVAEAAHGGEVRALLRRVLPAQVVVEVGQVPERHAAVRAVVRAAPLVHGAHVQVEDAPRVEQLGAAPAAVRARALDGGAVEHALGRRRHGGACCVRGAAAADGRAAASAVGSAGRRRAVAARPRSPFYRAPAARRAA
ncbi:non-ribosomal peptide synthase domain protein [Gracilaria domingensis]|nr:non-ribosomal peptide synthase domain protein [Gracilaria domingensis]